MKLPKFLPSFLILTVFAASAVAKKQQEYEKTRPLSTEQAALVNEAIAREKAIIQNIRLRAPLVETYIQNMRPDEKLQQVPVGDEYILARVDFGKGFFDRTYEPRSAGKRSFFKGSSAAISKLTRLLGLEKFTYSPTGFMQMMFLDPTGFDSQHYSFSYVRKEFLGSVRTWVFDVHPTVSGMGRFNGRIWIEDQEGNIVRFNGAYTEPVSGDLSKLFFHCDSWRSNVQPGVWLPAAVYVEESHRNGTDKSDGMKAQTHFWGYSLNLPASEGENVSVKVDDAVDESDDSQDVSPLEATRGWVKQAEDNIIDRLVAAGLVAPVSQNGYETKVLDQIVTNLQVPNNLAFPEPIRTRVLLSTTIEATTVGSTILISRGLIDSLPNEESIASVVAMELAHIMLGHHIDTRYAFNDRLLFPDESTFQRISMFHSDAANEAAAKTAMAYLQNSMYKDNLPSAALYYAQLEDRAKALKALNSARLGDSLLRADGTPWMSDLKKMAPHLNWDDLTQRAALPLGNWIKVDPWDDTVHMTAAKMYAYLNPSDKMPFEVTPIFYKLQRYGIDPSKMPLASSPVRNDGTGLSAADSDAHTVSSAESSTQANPQPILQSAPGVVSGDSTLPSAAPSEQAPAVNPSDEHPK